MLSGGKIGAIDSTQSNLPKVVSNGDFVPTGTTLRDIVLRSLYYEVKISPEYLRRLKRIVAKLKVNGVDIERIGTIKYTAHFKSPFQLGAEAGVDRTNTLFMNRTGGFEDWFAELILAHEHRHFVQNNETWNRIACSKGLDPQEYTLKQAMIEKKVPRHFQKVLEEYLEWDQNLSEAEKVFIELDAYLFMYDYYANHVEKGLDLCRKNYFERQLSIVLGYFLSLAQKTFSHNLSKNSAIYSKAAKLRGDLIFRRLKDSSTANRLQSEEVGNQCRSYFQSLSSRINGRLTFKNGSPYSLRERLEELHATANLGLQPFALGLDADLRSVELEPMAENLVSDINAHLNRQIVSYQFSPWEEETHRLYYRNDTQRFLDDFIRAQHVGEIDSDFDKEATLRAGHDIGIYFPFTEHLFLKAASLAYLGYQTTPKNTILGGRFDIGLHYDIDLTQRLGFSLAVGYSAGAQFGTKEEDVYHQIGFTSELFRY